MRRYRLLLVEDRPPDVKLTKRAIEKAGYDVDVEVAFNGREALDRLHRLHEHAGKPLPDLIILDWMMPLVSGEEVLDERAKDKDLRQIPVIVLTTSNAQTDVNLAYSKGCSSYLSKPVDPAEFQKKIEALGGFWLKEALLPQI